MLQIFNSSLPLKLSCARELTQKNQLFQIARELRLRDIGGIIVVDFIDMLDDCEFNSVCVCVAPVHVLQVHASLF